MQDAYLNKGSYDREPASDGTTIRRDKLGESLSWLSRKMNTLPGVARTVVSQIPGAQFNASPEYKKSLKDAMELAISGEAPSSTDLFGMDPRAGFLADMAMDPTPLALSGIVKAAKLGTKASLPVLRKGLGVRDSLDIAHAFPPVEQTLGEKVFSQANRFAKNPVSDAASRPVASMWTSLAERLRKMGWADIDAPVEKSMQARKLPQDTPLPSDLLRTTGLNAGKKLEKAIESRRQFTDELATKADPMAQTLAGHPQPGTTYPAMVNYVTAVPSLEKQIRGLEKINPTNPDLPGIRKFTGEAASIKPITIKESLQRIRMLEDQKIPLTPGSPLREAIDMVNSVGRVEHGRIIDTVDPTGVAARQYRQANKEMSSLIPAKKAAISANDVPLSTMSGIAHNAKRVVTGPLVATNVGQGLKWIGQGAEKASVGDRALLQLLTKGAKNSSHVMDGNEQAPWEQEQPAVEAAPDTWK